MFLHPFTRFGTPIPVLTTLYVFALLIPVLEHSAPFGSPGDYFGAPNFYFGAPVPVYWVP